MSTKHVHTTSELLRFGLKLTIECGHCGSTNILAGTELAKFPARTGLKSLQSRLRCNQCEQKAAILRWLS